MSTDDDPKAPGAGPEAQPSEAEMTELARYEVRLRRTERVRTVLRARPVLRQQRSGAIGGPDPGKSPDRRQSGSSSLSLN